MLSTTVIPDDYCMFITLAVIMQIHLFVHHNRFKNTVHFVHFGALFPPVNKIILKCFQRKDIFMD